MSEVFPIRDWATSLPRTVTVENNRIARVESIADAPSLPLCFPGFFDVQINGSLGVDFSSGLASKAEVEAIVQLLRSHHVRGFLATLITGESETIRRALQSLRQIVSGNRLGDAIPGFHLEGPYISAEDGPRGAHPLEHVRDPDWDEFRRWQDAAEGTIRLMTLAPERKGGIEFIRKLVETGVVVAIGHTAASGTVLRDAVQAGAKFSTHLGNGCHAMLPRHDNYIWEQLACDDLGASIIADGHHLPPAVLKTILRVKTPERLIVTCDASPLAGLPPGSYRHWGQDVMVEESGRIGVAGTPFLAGSGTLPAYCFQAMALQFDVGYRDTIQMMSVNPRRWLGLPVPELRVGAWWDDFIRLEDS